MSKHLTSKLTDLIALAILDYHLEAWMISLRQGVWCFGLLVFAATAQAQFVVTRGPINADPKSFEAVPFASGALELNASETPVLVEGVFSSTTRASVDAVGGTVRGKAGFSLTADAPASPEDTSTALAMGNLVYTANAGIAVAAPTRIEFRWDFHGSFLDVVGTPTLLLNGVLVVSTVDLGGNLTPVTYTSSVGFSSLNGAPLTTKVIAERLTQGGAAEPYADATPAIHSETFANLAATAHVFADISPGMLVVVSGSLVGGTAAALNGNGTIRLASAGTVDFLNTGQLQVVTPAGFNFDDSTGLFQGVVVVSNVPEPGSVTLVLAGLCVLAVVASRSRQKLGHQAS